MASINPKIRDVQRLLQRPVKATVREEKERALLGLKHQLQLVSKSNKDHKIAKRYQMVRFFGTAYLWCLFTFRAAESNQAATAGRETMERTPERRKSRASDQI